MTATTKNRKAMSEEELRRLTREETIRFEKLQAQLARAVQAKNGAAMQPIRKAIVDLEENVRRRVVSAKRAADKAETIALARARGEEVDDRGSATRMLTRTGIAYAFEKGHLDPPHGPMTREILCETAFRYRMAYLVASGGLTPEKGAGGGFNAKGPQSRLVEMGEELATMRLNLTKRQEDVLDNVCGLDMRPREAATVLRRGFPSVLRSLVSGLETATLNLKAKAAIKARGEPATRDRLEAAAWQIDQAMRSVR